VRRPDLERVLSTAVDAEGATILAPAHDLDQTLVLVARGDAVVQGDAGR